MNKKIVTNVALAGIMSLSLLSPSISAHDNLDDVSIEKGAQDGEQLNKIPKLEGTKNLNHWNEAAAVQIKEYNGKKNSTADVYAHKGFAYLGTHTSGGGNGGVRIFDLKDPSNPVEIAKFADDIPGTWQEKVIVKTVNTPYFKGDLAVVSVQQLNVNNALSKGGFLLYDVNDPHNPKKLGFWELDKRVRGTHELYLTVQGNKPVVLTANPYADYYTHGEQKDFALVDVTDPSNPQTVYEFDPRMIEEVPEDFNGYHWHAPDGKTRPAFNHSTMTDQTGKTAFLSFWDLGTIILDISNPYDVEYLGRTDFGPDVQGAAHSSALAKGGNVLVETREVYHPTREGYERSYGYTRIFDIKDKTNPKLLSTFKTDLVDHVEDGVTFANTVHDPKVHGNTLYLSHYAGGIRAVDITDPANPEQIGQYVPEQAFFWGVFVDQNYILASDMGQGLKVLLKNNSNNK
ncbi:LVIVD repeat-containing protein [Pseudalkalibacillus sp. Hm43]|uniref:LVIVD repeat-containing protein n=1 Tax=Pseudalkalibacillus sp. Hm43 TaxID=3450742 RepID=UPI003F444E8E